MGYHLKRKMMDPPGGWYFVTADGFRIKAGGLDKLVQMVRRHIEVNGDEVPEDIAGIVEDQICRRVPASLVLEPIFNRFPTEIEIDRATRKVVHSVRTQGLTESHEAVNRQKVCSDCHFNSWRHGCFSCSVAERLTNAALYKRPTNKNLRCCDITHSLCNALSYLRQDALAKLFARVPVEEFNEDCWIRKSLEAQDDNGS